MRRYLVAAILFAVPTVALADEAVRVCTADDTDGNGKLDIQEIYLSNPRYIDEVDLSKCNAIVYQDGPPAMLNGKLVSTQIVSCL